MKSKARGTSLLSTVGVLIVCIAFVPNANAQHRTKTTTTTGNPTQQVKVERGQVVLVAGRDLVVRMEDGTMRHFANVPDTFRATVDEKEIGFSDLKTGMMLERTTTITTTPKLITAVETIKGRVLNVQPPRYVTLTLDGGSSERFEIPKGQKFKIEGQTVDAWGLKPGMIVKATKVVEFTAMEVEQKRKVTGSMPLPPPLLPSDVPMLVGK